MTSRTYGIGYAEQWPTWGDDRLVFLGDLVLDLDAGCVRRDSETLPLSRQEFNLLLYLACRRRPVPWRELVSHVWQFDASCGAPEMVRNAVHRLRDKLDDSAEERYIRTVRGVGYQAME